MQLSNMRNYKRKSERGKVPPDVRRRAAETVIRENRPVRAVAREFGLCYVTLNRLVKKVKKKPEFNSEQQTVNQILEETSIGYSTWRQVFTSAQEQHLVTLYLQQASTQSTDYLGLSPQKVRKFAYQYAKHYQLPMPVTWIERGKAGVDWFEGFMKRNPEISLQTPEATSLGRATSSNKHNVKEFFNKLSEVYMDEYNFNPTLSSNGNYSSVTEDSLSTQSPSETELCLMPSNQTSPSLPEAAAPTSAQPETKETEASTLHSLQRTPASKVNSDFSPQDVIRLVPKDPTRKVMKSRKSAILTDFPEKQKLLEERIKGASQNKSKRKVAEAKGSKGKGIGGRSPIQNEWFCLVCGWNFANSQPGEKWVACQGCFEWAHEECTEGLELYLWHNCCD